MAKGKFLLLGDIDVDTTWPIDKFPIPGRDGLVDDIHNDVGGATLNSAVILDKLGMDAELIGCMGDDVWARYVQESLAETGIGLSLVHKTKNANTGMTVILVTPDGERTMFGYRGANKLLDPASIHPEYIQKAAILHFSGYAFMESPQRDAAWQAIAYAKEYRVPISVDTGLEPVLQNKKEFLDLLPTLEICITGLEEMSALLDAKTPEEAAKILIEKGVQLAVIKLGGKGSYFSTQDNQFFCPAFDVAVKDTTGAGDAFSAGVLYGWGEGLEAVSTAVLASALGALATTVAGAGLSLPGKAEIISFLERAPVFADEMLQAGLDVLLSTLKS